MRFGEALRLRARAHVPGHLREQHADAAAVEIRHHLFEARQAARHVAQQVVVVAVVDPDVGIDRPEQHAVDSAVTFIEIVEKAVHGVAPRHGVVEIAVFDHRLRLHEAALGPFQLGPLVGRAAQAGAHAPLLPPVLNLLQPLRGVGLRGRARQLLALRWILRILRRQQRRGGNQKDKRSHICSRAYSSKISFTRSSHRSISVSNSSVSAASWCRRFFDSPGSSARFERNSASSPVSGLLPSGVPS